MTDPRSRLLAAIDADLAPCEQATPGAWVGSKDFNVSDTGSAHYAIKNPTLQRPCPCGSKHPPGQLIAWMAGSLGDVQHRRESWRTDPDIEYDVAFISRARTALPAALRALREEVERHTGDRLLPTLHGSMVTVCCRFVAYPCPTLLRIARHLGVEP